MRIVFGHKNEMKDIPSPSNVMLFESELMWIARETLAQNVETGGSLFGLWSQGERPVIFLASPPGPSAVHESTHFSQNVRYVSDLASRLQSAYGIQYLGDWHSHHKLDLCEPSSGDRNRIRRVAAKNQYRRMTEIIVRHPDSHSRREDILFDAEFNVFLYLDAQRGLCQRTTLRILPGTSPIRGALSEENAAALEGSKAVHLANKQNAIPGMLQNALDVLCSEFDGEVDVYEDQAGYVVKLTSRRRGTLVIILSHAHHSHGISVVSVQSIDEGTGTADDIGGSLRLVNRPLEPNGLLRIYESVQKIGSL